MAADEGALVLDRPPALCGDEASSESALLHALDVLRDEHGVVPDITVLVQCTSPFIDPADLDAAVVRVIGGEADSAFAAVETHSFLWRVGDSCDGAAHGLNHDPAHRARRQDRRPDHRETGAFYVMRTDGFRAAGHRFFGTIVAAPVDQATAVEIDTHADLELARAIAEQRDEPTHLGTGDAVLDVDAVVTDFDGVHTDDTAGVEEDGSESVRVSRSDGMGVSALKRAGVPFLILSSETNAVVLVRARKLGVEVAHGVHDKATLLARWLQRNGLDPARVAYVGNDVNDLSAMAAVGWPIAVPGAHPDVLAAARVVLTRPGGHGAVREVADRVLAAAAGRIAADTTDSARTDAGSVRRHILPGAVFAPAPDRRLHDRPDRSSHPTLTEGVSA